MKSIRFDGDKHGTTYLGRNRHGACHGILVEGYKFMDDGRGKLEIIPINRVGRATQACYIEIPRESLADLIAALQSFLPPEA